MWLYYILNVLRSNYLSAYFKFTSLRLARKLATGCFIKFIQKVMNEEKRAPAATSKGKWKPVYTTANPMKYEKAARMVPIRRFSRRTGRVKPKASIIVVEGKEKSLVCQKPMIRASEITRAVARSSGLGLCTRSLINEPIA